MGFQEASGISENRLNSQALPAHPLPSGFSCEVLTVSNLCNNVKFKQVPEKSYLYNCQRH